MTAELQASRRDDTLILTFSNPGADNALHPDVCAAAIEVLSTADRDDSIRVVVLAGKNNTFSTGSNLNLLLENRSRDPLVQAEALDSLHGWIEALRDCSKPVIAAVEGVAQGAGFSLALACDLIVAAASSQFAIPSSRMALTPEGGASWLLLQSLPRQIASEILLAAEPVTGSRLHTLGVVNRVVADRTALDAAVAWADELGQSPPHVLERIKALIGSARYHTLDQQFEAEKQAFIESLFHRDSQEGIMAFLEKRKPHYK